VFATILDKVYATGRKVAKDFKQNMPQLCSMRSYRDGITRPNHKPHNIQSYLILDPKSDFNGDGEADIFWTNANTGQTALWEMDGSTIRQATFLTQLPLGWRAYTH
jgi:hypothetical protein